MKRKSIGAVLFIAALAFPFAGNAFNLNMDIVEAGEGIQWFKMGVILDIGNPGEPDSLTAGGGFVLYDENVYKMWYSALDGTYIKIMYATSSDGYSWMKHGVVVDLGEPGDPDDEYAKEPSVLRNNQGTYEMWYTGQSTSFWGWKILYATSNDGVNWQKHGVVFSKQDSSIGHPFVLFDNGLYRMWYSDYDGAHWRIGYAESGDGTSWTDWGIAIDIGPPGALDSKYVYEPGVIIEADRTHMIFYSVFDGNPNNIVDVHYATSPDGIGSNWKKQGLSLRHGEEGDYDEVQVLRPIVTVNPDGSHMLWYTGKDATNGRMMLAVEKSEEIEAIVDCGPQTLNLKSKGNWITCYIELPVGYDPRDIDARTIQLNSVVQPELDPKYGFVSLEGEYITDHDSDGIEERLIKFGRAKVQEILDVGHAIVLSISGKLYDGTMFFGTYTIRVIEPPVMVPLQSEVGGYSFGGRRSVSIEPLFSRTLI